MDDSIKSSSAGLVWTGAGTLVNKYADVVECLRAFDHVGFFLACGGVDRLEPLGTNAMDKLNTTMAQRIAQAASAFQQQRTGHQPKAVTVVLSEDTLVITLHEALSPAERALATSAAGAARVQEFHRQLFSSSSESLRQAIKEITGVEVREATAEVEPRTGAVVQVFTTGTMVQVFLLASGVPAETWSGAMPALLPNDPEAEQRIATT